jgi:TolB-like protein/Tfp pilus assembly protein PilF
MGEASPNSTVTTPSGAVFLSYASQDAGAAKRICDALRAAGVEVWFDQSELRGGDAWDHKIRQQIHDCRMFIALISAHTEARSEGYFRREWKIAVDRTHDMSERQAFIVPVVIDGTSDATADVPEAFSAVQWIRLTSGEVVPEFVGRVQQLLSGDGARSPTVAGRPARVPAGTSSWANPVRLAAAAALIAAAVFLLIVRPWPKPAAPTKTAAPVESTAAFQPPPHSIAVLPFVNLSGDKEQEYFSDGLTEELLNSLAEIEGLQVAARTSSFTFREHPDIVTVAHKLNVATVLEGSVRRSGNTVRVTTQLINAATGFHLWSHTYDRDLGDVLKLQTDIAGAVASALKVSLLGNVAARIELGGTNNAAAFDAFLRARKSHIGYHSGKDLERAITDYSQAIHLDPNYALAFADRSLALSRYADNFATGKAIRESHDQAQSDALKAISLAPDLAEGHLALGRQFWYGSLALTQASEEYERALALAPGNADVLEEYGIFAVLMGRKDEGIAALRRAVVLDPLDRWTHFMLGASLRFARQYKEAVAALQENLALDPDDLFAHANLGLAYYALGNLQSARTSCESTPDFPLCQVCLAITYDKLGQHADAEAMLAKYRASRGDVDAFNNAEIYAQWGNRGKALEWLETAMRLRDSGLAELKTDSLLDPLRNEPRFQAIERELKFPD